MIFVSTTTKDSKETIQMIDWYLATFEYKRITTRTTDKKWNNTYFVLGVTQFNSIRKHTINYYQGKEDLYHLRFLFKNIEDKTLFDLTWR